MTPADIVTAIHASGATVTTDGRQVYLEPARLVQPIIMQAAREAKPALIGHLIDTGRLHGPDGQDAARLASRLTTGLDMLQEMEIKGQTETERYRRLLVHFRGPDEAVTGGMLAEYERIAACGAVAA